MNTLGRNLITSFNYLLNEKVLTPEEGVGVAQAMTEVATIFKAHAAGDMGTVTAAKARLQAILGESGVFLTVG